MLLLEKSKPQRTQGEKMKFRPHSVVAVLLFPAILFAQAAPPASKPKSSKPAAAPVSGGAYPTMSKQAKQRGQQVFEMFESGQVGALWAALSDGAKKSYGSLEKFTAAVKNLREHLGTEKKMVDENIAPFLLTPGTLYSRLSDFTNVQKVHVITTVGINERGQVDAFQVGPERIPSQGHFGGYKDVTKLKLPFSGAWFVDQGGRSIFQNLNFMSEDQRFSIDFILLKNGRPFSGDGSDNAQYYCFGQPLLAPADGQVVDVQDGYQDNAPGSPSPD